MLNKIYKTCFTCIIAVSPIFAFAILTNTKGLLNETKNIITTILIPLAFMLALFFFFYGVAKYIWSAGTDKDEGKKIMYWGVIALFVMSSIWGIIYFMRGELGINSDSTVPI